MPITRQGYLVTGTDQRYWEPRAMQVHFKRVLEQAELRQVNFHALEAHVCYQMHRSWI